MMNLCPFCSTQIHSREDHLLEYKRKCKTGGHRFRLGIVKKSSRNCTFFCVSAVLWSSEGHLLPLDVTSHSRGIPLYILEKEISSLTLTTPSICSIQVVRTGAGPQSQDEVKLESLAVGMEQTLFDKAASRVGL
jgi:hypothetical protein